MVVCCLLAGEKSDCTFYIDRGDKKEIKSEDRDFETTLINLINYLSYLTFLGLNFGLCRLLTLSYLLFFSMSFFSLCRFYFKTFY